MTYLLSVYHALSVKAAFLKCRNLPKPVFHQKGSFPKTGILGNFVIIIINQPTQEPACAGEASSGVWTLRNESTTGEQTIVNLAGNYNNPDQ
jgi:hypothetical protein